MIILRIFRYSIKKDNYYINVYNYNDFLYNILENDLVPPHRVMNEEEKVN